MEENNFFLDLIASLKKNESKKQIQSDIKEIGDIKIPLTGTLSKSKTRKQIKEDVKNLGDINASLVGKLNKSKTKAQIKKDLESTNSTVNLTGKVDSKGIATSVKQAASQAQRAANSNPVDIDVAFKVKKEKLLNDIKLLAQQNSKLFKNTDMSIKYNTLLDNAEIARNTVELSTLRTQLGSLRSELKVTGNAGMTMTDTLKSGLSKILQLFGGHGIITQFTAQLRNAWTEAKELDSAMTDLSRVNSEITRSGFPGYLDKVISKTKELSVATKDYIDAVTTFSRAGYNLADSEILASAAVQLEKVGDMTAEAASKSLLSGLQAYGEIDGYGMDQLAEKAQALNDKIDLIGNTASISQAEVADGIQAVGSVMSDANTSVDEFISLLAAGNRSVQDSNKVALAIRTSALRIRGCTSELEEMGETTDDVIESTSTLAAKIKALTNIDGNGGVNILEADEETFRSIYDIYNDIAKVYDKMSDVDASSLLDLIAGKNRSNQVSAILQNMSEANELLEKSLNAAGTATAEYEIYLDSAQAASERFGVAMTETYNNILNEETVKGLTNAGTAVLEFANKFGILEGTLKGFLALGVLKGITTLTAAFKNSAVQVSNYGSALNEVKKVSTFAEDTRDYADAMKNLKTSCTNLTDAQLKQVLANRNLEKSQLIEILQLKTLKKEEQDARLAQLGLIQTTNEQTVANGAAAASTFSLKSAMTGLWASIKSAVMSNPVGIAIMGISAIIGVVTSQISKYNQKIEEARQKAKELADAYRQQQSSLDSQIKKYKELKESLDSGNLSTDEARSVKEQLLDIQNSLVDSYGNEASSIDLLNGKYREQLGLLGELSKEKAEDFIVENRDVYDDAKKQLEKERTFDLGTVTSWSNYAPKTQDQQNLIDYIEAYSKFLELTYKGGGGTTAVNVSVKADVQNADEVMRQFAKDLEEYGATNGIDVSNILDQIPEQLRSAWTDELKEYKTVYDEFIKAEVIRSDTLRPLYHESIKAVEEYNNALSSGEGVSEAKANLDSVQQSVQSVTGQLEGSQDIFDGIYEGINRSAEAAYNLSQAFETDETVKKYAEQLRGLTDIDLKAINFEDSVQSPGEEAFGALIEILGLSEDEVQKLIDKLVELGYVQGEIQSSAQNIEISFNIEDYKDTISDVQSSISTLRSALDSLNSGDLSKIEVVDLMQQFPDLVPYIDLTADGFGNLSAGLSELIAQQPTALIQSLEELKGSLTTEEERVQVDLLIDSLQRLSSYGDTGMEAYATTIGATWSDTANVIEGVTTQFENLAKVQEAVSNGLTISATAAAELAKMYPEILTNAEFSANGQLTLNEAVVKSILEGDNSIISAQIAKLEADKAELTSKKTFAEAQLNIARQIGEGEGKISEEVARYRLDIANQLAEKLIEAGMEEDKAYAAVAESMAGNMDEYNRIVSEVAEDTSKNIDAAAVSMAESININSINAQTSFENLRNKVCDLAEAIKNAAQGKQGGNAGIYGGGGSTSKGGISASTHSGSFNTTYTEYTAQIADFDSFQSQLELDIKGYTDAISNIDSQIEVLKNLQQTFDSNDGIGGHSYSDKIKQLEKEKESLNNAAKDSAKSTSDSNKETAESFNWIEKAVSRVQRTIKNLGNTVSATWKSWTERNNSLVSQLNEVRKEISIQQSAYESYMNAAESVGLSDHYKSLVQNGALSIEDIADDTLKEQIKSYQEWYEKALDCSDAIQELNSQLAELAKTKFDNVSARYDAGIQDVDFVISLINTELDKTDALNQIAGESFYNALIDKEKERIDILTSEYDELCQVFNESVATGMIAEGSEAWQGMKSGIDSVAESIREAEVQILKYENSIKKIAKLKFDDLQKQFENAANVITSNISKIEKEISLVEESGAIAGETFYQALIESGRTNLEALEQKHRSLSDSLKEALDNGSVEEYDDTWFEMTDSISSVEEAILDARLALIKYEESMKQVAKIKFDDLAKQFDNVTSAISGNQSIIEKQIAYMEATGKVAGKAFYEGLISSEEEKLSTLEQQFASLSQALQEALDSGSVVEGDDTFYEMTGQLTDLEGKIWDSRTALVEFNKELDNVAKIRFDTVGDAFSQVTGLISSDISIIEKQIALVEDSGRIAGESFYRALIESANQSAEIAEQKYNAMAAELQKGLDDGSITMYDDNWYEMSTELNNIKLEWLDAQDAVVKYQNSLKEVASIKFDSIESQFDNAISLITHGISRIEKEIDAVEQSGMIAGESYYKELQKLQDKNIDTLKKKYDELTSILNEALDNGSVTEYSEEWYEMVTAINSVEGAIYDAESAAAKYGEQIKEIAKLKFDSLNSQFSNAINLVTSDMGLIEKQMALIEASGKEVGESFYRELIDAGNTKIDALKKQYDELYKAMEGVEKYSDNWYEMADTLYKIRGEIIDTETAVVRYGNSLKEVSMIKFDNISEQFDTALSLISYQIDEIELKMQIAQESGYIAGESFYKALISAETKNLEVLEKEYDALLSALNEALANGSIEKYDEKWVAAVQKIAAVRKAILNSQLAQAKYQSSLNNSTSGGTNTTRDIAKETFDSLEKQFSGAIGIITSAIDQLEKKMSFVEEAGYVAGESFYNALIEAEKTHIESLVKEYETLTSSLNNVEKYSDNWYDMVGSINSVKDALIDAETALVKYGNALKELEWDMFDRAQESVSRLSGESDFITELMGTNRETRNEDGTLNDRGLAVQGLHAVNYDVYMRQAQEYGEAIKKLNKEIAEDPGNTKLLDRYNELMELQRDAILNAEDEKTALKDLASEGYDSLLSRLDELTGARKDALKAASDLHDYEKTVSEQSAEVTRLQKLILNYSGNDSEEMRATIQKTQEALTKAQEELSETEYDRYIADQESMLDTFSDSMKEWVNTRLDDINGLLQNAINATNNSAQAIRDQISTDLSSVGMSMTDNFSKIFELDYSGGLMDIVSEYYGGGFENGLTTVNTAIDNVILETDMVKASTDMVSEILNQRFPELAASIPTLDATNDRIGNVSEAVVKTKDAMDNVHARIGELDTDTLKPKFDYVGEGIEGFDEDFNNLMKNLDGDLEQYDKNSGENLGSVEEAMEGVDAKVSETGSIANKLGDINTAVNNVKTPVEELKTPLDNVKTATEGTKETVDRIKTKLEDDSQDSIMGKIGSVTSAVGIAKTEVTSLNTLTQMNLGKVKDEITTVKNVLERIDTTVANLTLDRPGYGNSNSTPDYTVQNISEYGNSNNSTQSSGNSGNDQYQFIDKEDSYNKSQLNTSTSIVDLLKSNNYDSSLSARKKYYEDLGGSGEFIGSDAQNKWLMEKMHAMGYKNGVHNLREDEIAITQEDGTEAILSPYYGGVLTPLHKGDSVLTAEQTENLFRVSNIDADELRERIFGNTMPKHDVSKLMPERSNVNTNNSVSNNDIDVSFNIPNVRDSDEMAKFLKSDRAERIITSIMDTYALGKNKYRKLRY